MFFSLPSSVSLSKRLHGAAQPVRTVPAIFHKTQHPGHPVNITRPSILTNPSVTQQLQLQSSATLRSLREGLTALRFNHRWPFRVKLHQNKFPWEAEVWCNKGSNAASKGQKVWLFLFSFFLLDSRFYTSLFFVLWTLFWFACFLRSFSHFHIDILISAGCYLCFC